MEESTKVIVDFIESKSKSKSKFYFNDFLPLFPEKKPREVKKILSQLVKERSNGILVFRFHYYVRS